MTTRGGSGAGDLVSSCTSSTSSTSCTSCTSYSSCTSSLQQQSGGPAPPGPEAAGGVEMFGEFQDWCSRTYGDSGKTKTVTRRKYHKILQTLLLQEEEQRPGLLLQEKSSSHINAKFKFWVKSKGFQVRTEDRTEARSPAGRPVLYVPVKCVDSVSGPDSSLKRVAVVEDFFSIIFSMHVEISSDPAKAPKHAGQKKTYKAIAETYAFLPREAVTHFLMSCGECQKRMHISSTGPDFRGALKKNLAAELIGEDLVTLGLSEDKASHFSQQWAEHQEALSRQAVSQALMVNQLLDMEWKFGVTVGTSETQKVGNIYLQLKLVVRKGNSTENVFMELTLPQFYNFLHEMERAKASMECFS